MSSIFDLVKSEVPIHALMDKVGVLYPTREKNCKVSCPFHGHDNRKSGFIYVDTNTFRCFTCNESWDQLAFWAQANEWWKVNANGDEVLDMGKALASLKEMYNLEYVEPSWEQKFRELAAIPLGPSSGYDGYRLSERRKLAQYVFWRTSQRFARLSREDRARTWSEVQKLWDEAEDLDIAQDGWKTHLNLWQERATLVA